MYATYRNEQGQLVKENRLVGHQLLLNYCMGHGESSLLLCPYSSFVNFINHNQTRANVKLQWAQNGFLSHNASYFDLRVSEMNATHRTNLAMEYVAMRDIKPGEELFLDYGNDWQEAWDHHVENWRPPNDPEYYIDAASFNDLNSDLMDPYPSNLEMRCHPVLGMKNWHNLVNNLVWSNYHKECEILARQVIRNEIVYTVQMGSTRIQGVPRKCISFFDKLGTTDMHLIGAFRHEVGIPNDMFPSRWRNRE